MTTENVSEALTQRLTALGSVADWAFADEVLRIIREWLSDVVDAAETVCIVAACKRQPRAASTKPERNDERSTKLLERS